MVVEELSRTEWEDSSHNDYCTLTLCDSHSVHHMLPVHMADNSNCTHHQCYTCSPADCHMIEDCMSFAADIELDYTRHAQVRLAAIDVDILLMDLATALDMVTKTENSQTVVHVLEETVHSHNTVAAVAHCSGQTLPCRHHCRNSICDSSPVAVRHSIWCMNYCKDNEADCCHSSTWLNDQS